MVTPAQAITPEQKDCQHYVVTVPPQHSLIEIRIENRDNKKDVENWWVTAEDACRFGEEVYAWKREYQWNNDPDFEGYTTYARRRKLNLWEYLSCKNLAGPYNIFIGMVARKYPNGSLAQDAVDDIFVVWADFDTEEAIKGYFEQVETKGFLAPTFVTMSGNGYHVYWKLSEPISHRQFRAFQQLLADRFKSDCSIKDAARLDRLPGFVNYKLDKDPRRAYVHTPPNDNTYTIAQIEQFIGVETGSVSNLPDEPDEPEKQPRNRNRSKSGSTTWDDASAVYWGDWKVGTPIHHPRPQMLISISGYLRAKGFSCAATQFILSTAVAPYVDRSAGSRNWNDVAEWSEYYANETRRYTYITPEYGEGSTYSQLYASMMAYRNFPIDVLPTHLQETARHYSKLYNCAIDYVAVPLLVGMAWAHGPRVAIRTRGMLADARMASMSVGISGKGKSVTTEPVVLYIKEVDRQFRQLYIGEMEEYERDKEVHEAKVSTARRKQAAGDPKKHPCDEVEPLRKKPVCKESILEDGTVEGTTRTLKDGDSVVLSIDDWFAWLGQLGKYNNARAIVELTALQKYLELNFWIQIKHSRAKFEDSTVIEQQYLSMIANIQPDVINTLFCYELIQTGFVHRILYFWPDEDEYNPPDRNQHVVPVKYQKAISDILDGLRQETYNPDFAVGEGDGVVYFKLIDLDSQSEDIQNAYYDWFIYLDRIANNQTLDNAIRGHFSRMKKHFSRMLLNLHLLRCHLTGKDIDVIELETIRDAVALCRYFLSGFFKLYDRHRLGSGDTPQKQSVLTNKDAVLKFVQERPSTTVTQIREAKKRLKLSRDTIRLILTQLEEDGMGTCVKDESGIVTGFNSNRGGE